MPMLDLNQRYQDAFRIRLGEKKGNLPKALTDRIRITAANKAVPEAFAEIYGVAPGSELSQWEDEWQVHLPITALPIWLLPGQSVIQWWEKYRGKVCDRRCDGVREQLSGQPCMCPPDIDARMNDAESCSPMTRVSVACPEVPAVLGTGALVTHSRIAAETIPSAVWMGAQWLEKNLPVKAVLRVYTHRGRTTFTFPTIEVLGPAFSDAGESPAPLGSSLASKVQPQVEGGPSAALGTGVAPSEVPAASPAPPSADDAGRPFDEGDEVLVPPAWVKAATREVLALSLSGEDLGRIVEEATGRTPILQHVRRTEANAVLDALRKAKAPA